MKKNNELLKNAVENINNNLKEYYQNIMNDIEDTEDTEDTEDEIFNNYIDDALDIKYILNSDKTLDGVQILVSFGGPNIWIDTSECVIRGYWGGSQHTCILEEGIAEYINSQFEYIF